MNQTPSYLNSAVFSPISNPRQFTDEVEDFLPSLDNPEEAGQMEANEWSYFGCGFYIFIEVDRSCLEEQDMELGDDLQVTEARDEEPVWDWNLQEEAAQNVIEWNEDLFDYDLNQIDTSCLEEHEMEMDEYIQVEATAEEPDFPIEVVPTEPSPTEQVMSFEMEPEEQEIFVDQEHQATESVVEEQNPQQSSFINEPLIILVHQGPERCLTFSEQPTEDVHWFSRKLLDLLLQQKYTPKIRLLVQAREFLARYEKLFDLIPKAKRIFIDCHVFKIVKVPPANSLPQCPSENPFESPNLLVKYGVPSYEQLYEKLRNFTIDERKMSQILWDFYDYYHVKGNQFS